MYRDLLVHVDGSGAGRRRVQLAVELATLLEAQLSGLHVTPPVEVAHRYKPSHVASAAARLASRLASDCRTAATIFREETSHRVAGASWLEADGDVVRGICDKARYADLVILGQHEHQGPAETHPLPIAHSVVLQGGRPVLVVPPAAKPGRFARVALAWDGSREAVRAVHDAVPLLRLSAAVQIVKMVGLSTGRDEGDVKSLAEHLAKHGIRVADALQVRTAAENEALRNQIAEGQYDLLVMGGYSHPMWFESIFGGATQSILLSSKIPVFVSH
jgi:nucleotide-binding universal stress UspA family protein